MAGTVSGRTAALFRVDGFEELANLSGEVAAGLDVAPCRQVILHVAQELDHGRGLLRHRHQILYRGALKRHAPGHIALCGAGDEADGILKAGAARVHGGESGHCNLVTIVGGTYKEGRKMEELDQIQKEFEELKETISESYQALQKAGNKVPPELLGILGCFMQMTEGTNRRLLILEARVNAGLKPLKGVNADE